MCKIELRCPADREHKIRGFNYDTCGNLFGGIDVENPTSVTLRCPTCGSWWDIVVDSDKQITMNRVQLSAGEKINFDKSIKRVNDA